MPGVTYKTLQAKDTEQMRQAKLQQLEREHYQLTLELKVAEGNGDDRKIIDIRTRLDSLEAILPTL